MKCDLVLLVVGFSLMCGVPTEIRAASEPLPVKGMEEVLLPLREVTADEQAQVAAARDTFLQRTDRADVSAWESYLAAHPDSPYKLAILTNLGTFYLRSGRFTQCLAAYEAAWQEGKTVRGGPVEPLAGRAAGELGMMYARLGRYESLEQLLREVKGREFRGPGSNLIDNARSGFEMMESVPETSFRCGPMALSRILASQGKDHFPLPIRDSVSTREGMSLAQVKEIADKVGLEGFQVAKRAAGAPVLAPSVVHWKAGHYAALVREEKGRYLVEDPTFALRSPIWVTPQTLETEASGYFLVGAETLPAGWTAVPDAEAATVWGKGQTDNGDPDRTGPDDHKSGGQGNSSGGPSGPCGMATWSVHSMLVSLNIMDQPMGYSPPVGPAVSVLLTYNSRENESLATPLHTNFGPKWNFNGVAWIYDMETSAIVNGGYGGSETYSQGSNPVAGQFERNKRSYTTLVRTSALPTFERTWPDGTKEVYGIVGPNGLIYRTQLTDPTGNTLEFQYNTGSAITLSKIVDEIGQETVFEYATGGLQPTKITDPFGRFSTFQYDATGRLTHITDVVGITSQFTYKAEGNFIQTLTTPYGSTQFATGAQNTTRWLQVTHPNGDLERMEFRHNAEGLASNLGAVPENMLVSGAYHNFRNAFHWDRKAMKEAPGDVSKARLTHFLHSATNTSITSGLVECEKGALQGRVFYNYEGQWNPNIEGTGQRVTRIGRLLDDGTTQLSQIEYNAAGNPTKLIDPLGRTTLLTYAANLSDVLEVRQQVGATTELLMSMTYNAQGQPLTVTDGGGHTATTTYNSRGQPLTVTRANGDVTTHTYDANGYLTAVDGPLAGTVDRATFTYDAKGRVASITDSQSLTLSVEYDNLNRLTKRTYADASYEQWTYDALTPLTFRSRDGKVLTYQHNSMAQITRITDNLNRPTVLDWCRCGDLKTIIDPAGKMTRFFHDVQGRITGRAYADGTTTQVLYEPMSGRVASTVDELGRSKVFTYAKDDRLTGLSYGGTAPALDAASFTWDPHYTRPTGFSNATGATTLTYHPYQAGQNGAGMLASTDGPLSNDTTTFNYDSVGRVTSRGVDGVLESFTLDAASRPTSIANFLGTTGYTYDGASTRPLTVSLPGGQLTQMSYQTSNAMKLLKDLTHKKPGGAEVSRFAYTYDSALSVSGISRSFDGGPILADTTAYDGAQRLTSYVKALSGGGTQTHTYAYDAANNRTSETIGASTTTADANVLNQITQLMPAPAAARTYEWDGAGRLGAIVMGTHRSEFSYDAFGRRVRMVEKENGSTVADRRFIWLGGELAQERDAAGTLVKRFFAQGFSTSAGVFFYTRDNLGSIREVLDASGVVRARYDYDPYGRRVKISGDVDADMGYASMFHHAPSQLSLAFARAYDPALGRWVARDPAGEAFGFNLYAYVNNDPLSFSDPSGLEPDWVGAGGSLLQAAGCIGGAVVTVGVLASAPVAAPAVVALGVGLVAYNSIGAMINIAQAFSKIGGEGGFQGAGGSEFQFNPVTEGAHWLGLGGECGPIMEVFVQAGGIGFDIFLGNKLNGAAQAPALVGKVFGAAETAGHFGNTANIGSPLGTAAGTPVGSQTPGPVPLSPYPGPAAAPNNAPSAGRPAFR